MAKKKINLLFDATIIMNAYDKKQTCRSGIFFVALNVLKELVKRKNIIIYLYAQNSDVEKKWKELKTSYFENIDCKRVMTCGSSIYEKCIYKINKNLEKIKYFRLKKKRLKCLKINIKIFYLKLLALLTKKKAKIKYAGIDVFLSPLFRIPDSIKDICGIKKFVILYDLVPNLFPEKYQNQLKPNTWYSYLLNSLNHEDWYFSISSNTKKDFLKYYPVLDENKIIVTLLGHEEKFHPCDVSVQKDVRNKYAIPINKKYIFSLCNLDERKNLIREVKTFYDFLNNHQISDMVFVLGGAKIDSFMKDFEQSISELNNQKNNILYIGYVDDEDLPALYSGAEWFVYTSQYEGFGLPPLEAMACGCPVITSNNSSLPEVVGDAGIMIDWDSDEQHIKAYEKYYFDEKYRNEMAQKGLERAKQFSWERCVNRMVQEFSK